MGYVLKAVLSSAQHPEYGQITVPFPIPDEKYDRMIELLEPLEIGDALRQDCRVDELDSFYTVLNRLVGSLVNFDELDYLAKRLDSFDDGEAAQFQGMACKLGVSNIKDFINLTFCCQQATVITDFSDLDAIGRQHYMTMQGGGCRIEELERLDGRKFALDLILNHLEGRITPYGVVYDNGMKLEQLYDGRHFPCYHYQPNLLAVGLSSRQEPENTDQITWLLLPCSEQQLQRGIARSGVNIHDARIWYEDSLLPSEVEEVLEGQREDLFALNDMATAIAALSDLEQKKLTAVMEMAKPECAGEIRELAKNLELFEFAPKVWAAFSFEVKKPLKENESLAMQRSGIFDWRKVWREKKSSSLCVLLPKHSNWSKNSVKGITARARTSLLKRQSASMPAMFPARKPQHICRPHWWQPCAEPSRTVRTASPACSSNWRWRST